MEKKYKLEKEFGEKWVKALRSGKYKQGRSYLFNSAYSEDQYCCIGVCGVLLGIPKDKMEGRGLFYKGDGGCYSKLVPKELYGKININPLVGKLVHMNDDEGKDFKQIASWIRRNVEFI